MPTFLHLFAKPTRIKFLRVREILRIHVKAYSGNDNLSPFFYHYVCISKTVVFNATTSESRTGWVQSQSFYKKIMRKKNGDLKSTHHQRLGPTISSPKDFRNSIFPHVFPKLLKFLLSVYLDNPDSLPVDIEQDSS